MAYELQSYRDPFQQIQDRALRMMQLIASGAQPGQQRGGRDGQQEGFIPPAEAIEDDNAYLLTIEVPGVDPKDVDVSVVGNSLTIKAERRRQGQEGQQGGQQTGQQTGQGQQGQQRARHYLFSELSQGTLRREFGLPEDADRNRINAEFRNGLLTLTIPKSQEQHQRRRIDVKTS